MREKLLYLLDDALSVYRLDAWENSDRIANHLIAHGVTIPVRCKDCKNRDDITGECKHPKAVGWDVLMPEDDDFCSYGERRTDE